MLFLTFSFSRLYIVIMKIIIQRVTRASVTIGQQIFSSIEKGMLILAGIQADDSDEDITWLASKIVNLRIFDDENGVMNKSILEIGERFSRLANLP